MIVSCETDLTPRDTLTPDAAYIDIRNLQLGLNGVYRSYDLSGVITFNSIFTDETKIGRDSGGQQRTLYEMNVTAGTNGAGIWSGAYSTINRANRIIEAAAKITPTGAERAQYDKILADCYAIRAASHLTLLSHFCTNMEDDNALATPYIDFVNGPADDLPRISVGAFKQKLIADIDMAETLMGSTNYNNNKTTFSQRGLNFLRARLALYTGDNLGAITFADLVINSGMSLANPTQYKNMFLDTDDTEVVLSLARTPQEGRIGGIWYFTGTGGAFMEMSNFMYQSLDKTLIDPTNPALGYVDVRTGVLFNQAASDASQNFHLINKYPGSQGFLFLNNQKAMRLSELYLIKAEAQAKLSQFTQSATTLQALVNARFGSFSAPTISYNNLQSALLEILEQRNLELGYEGHRYVDLRRLRNLTNTGIERNPLDCGSGIPCGLGISDHRFTMPVPLSSITNNPNMIQNPGY
ncbi:MAG: RagB/SusD family nutrient uptake outer membrane protein [Flavobacterium sp.]